MEVSARYEQRHMVQQVHGLPERIRDREVRSEDRGNDHGSPDIVDKDQLRELIVDVLEYLEPEIPFSDAAGELLMLTAAQESHSVSYTHLRAHET